MIIKALIQKKIIFAAFLWEILAKTEKFNT